MILAQQLELFLLSGSARLLSILCTTLEVYSSIVLLTLA